MSNNAQKKHGRLFFLITVSLTLLMPLLPAWHGPVGAPYLFVCFLIGLVSGLLSMNKRTALLGGVVLVLGWMIAREMFFSYEQQLNFFLPIVLQGGTTTFVAQIGVSWLYEQRQRRAQLAQANNQLTS